MVEKKNNALEKVQGVIDRKMTKEQERAHKKAERQKQMLACRRERERKRNEKLRVKNKRVEDRREQAELKSVKSEKGNKKQRKNNLGFVSAIVSLSVATLVLASVLTYTLMMPSKADKALDATYSRYFYDTVEQVENIDINLSKALSSKDTGAMQKYLIDTAIESELAENDLQSLPLKDESKYYTTKLINQIGDYAKYLNNKLIDGEPITEEDYASLRRLYEANVTFKQALQSMIENMGDDYSFKEMASGGNDKLVEGFNELQNISVDYPELIYDGPFSDGLDRREIKGLKGNEVDEIDAKVIFNKTFDDYDLDKVKCVGETAEGIKCYNFQGENKDGEILYAEISKIGGKVVMFTIAGSCEKVNIDRADAEKVATDFLEKLGITDMKAVWTNLENNVYTFNFAYEQDGIICYADLIKVRVCADSGRALGIEATSYYTNHQVREISNCKLLETEAREKVSSDIIIETARKVIVPIGVNGEKTCYEFSGRTSDSTFYVYIDANTGKQVEMFKVVQGTEGELLM